MDTIKIMRCATHPGAVLREDVLPALDMSVSAFEAALKVSRQTVHGILAEKHAVTPEMALRLGAYLGNRAQLWLAMQAQHDLWLAEQKLADVLPILRHAPTAGRA